MGDSIFSKLRLVTLGNLHNLLNAVIDMNSVAAVEQHLRDLEKSAKDMRGDAAQAEGRKRFLKEEISGVTGKLEGIDDAIARLLGDENPDNDHLTDALAVQAVSFTEEKEELDAELVEATEFDQDMDQAVSQIMARIETFRGQLRKLRTTQANRERRQRAAGTLQHAAEVMEGGSDINVDNIIDRERELGAGAQVELEQALGDIRSVNSSDATMGKAAAYLARKKAELGINS